jgi:hypothetical protein
VLRPCRCRILIVVYLFSKSCAAGFSSSAALACCSRRKCDNTLAAPSLVSRSLVARPPRSPRCRCRCCAALPRCKLRCIVSAAGTTTGCAPGSRAAHVVAGVPRHAAAARCASPRLAASTRRSTRRPSMNLYTFRITRTRARRCVGAGGAAVGVWLAPSAVSPAHGPCPASLPLSPATTPILASYDVSLPCV